MTDQTDNFSFESNLLGIKEEGYAEDGEAALNAIFNGWNVRGGFNFEIPDQEWTYKDWAISFDDLIKVFRMYNISVMIKRKGIDFILSIEKLEAAFDTNVMMVLNDVKDLSMEVLSDNIYNTFTFGSDGDTDGTQGDEFNLERKYSHSVQAENELEVIAEDFVTSFSTITQAALLPTVNYKNNSEDSLDDTNMIVNCVRIQDYPEFTLYCRPQDARDVDVYSSDISPQNLFNIAFSPKRTLLRFGNVIRAYLDNSNKPIKFVSGKGNNGFSSKLITESKIITEDTNVDIAELAEPIYNTELWSFESPLSDEQIMQIRSNPYRLIKFTDNIRDDKGMVKYHYGWIWNVDMSEINHKFQEIKLINISNYINPSR